MPRGHKEGCTCGVCKSKRGETSGSNNPMYGKVGSWSGKVGFWSGKSRPDHSRRLSGSGGFWYGKTRPDQSERMKNNNPMFDELTRKKLGEYNSNLIAQKYIDGKIRFKTGSFYSVKNKKNLYYRSSYELAAYKLLEDMPKVSKYEVEPFSISYIYDGIKRNYIPDILIKKVDGSKLLIEVMSNWQYSDKKKVAKLEAGESYCRKEGCKFMVWTEYNLFDRRTNEFC